VDSFSDLIGRLREGDDRAAQQVFSRYVPRLVALARSQIDAKLRHKLDPEDVVQSAFRSFFRRQEAAEFDLANWDSLWGLLSLITVRKCATKAEHFLAAKRGGGQEMSLYAIADDSPAMAMALDRAPSPEEAAILLETVEEALRGFVAEDRQVIELSLQGFDVAEISDQLSRAERSVRRLRERVKKRLWRMIEYESIDE
jgi:RNA polymerase sigma-70 factor (ECF subfamily)